MPRYPSSNGFVPGCNAGTRTCREKRHLFRAPKDQELLAKWKRAIPRADKELDHYCKICDQHFVEEDIIKEDVHQVNGETVRLPRQRWALAPGAVPCIFEGSPSYLSKRKHRRPAPKQRSALGTGRTPKRRKIAETSEDTIPHEAPVADICPSQDNPEALMPCEDICPSVDAVRNE